MTHELILTSVAQGLDPKESGFCPVAVDSEVSPRILRHLQTLNSYRHLAPTSDGFPHRNPVAYSHLILPGEIEHVLSRVADAGTEYNNQPSVLAHHIVLDRIEAPPESPGWLLALPGFHFEDWTGPPLRFPQGRPIPTLTTPPSLTRRQQIARQCRWLDPQKMALVGSVNIESESYRVSVQNNDEQIALAVLPTSPCPVWKTLSGDPGWGGVLAETALTEQPVVLIYNPYQNILPLFVEALALLPSRFAWKVTFSTYFTGLPDTMPCQWKGVVAGSPEAEQLTKDANNLILDLTVSLGEALTGKYVDFARIGQEYMIPLADEENVTALVNADTKSYEDTRTDLLTPLPAPPLDKIATPTIQTVPPPKSRTGLSELFLRRTSRFQFYFLYSIMFVLVLVLLILVADKSNLIDVRQMVQSLNQSSNNLLRDPEPAPQPEDETESELDQVDAKIVPEPDDPHILFAEIRDQQREPLLRLFEDFDVPPFLAINFPDVKDNNDIDPPVKKAFGELSPLHPFGSALELRFVPLFELPKMTVNTRLDFDALPDLVWKVEAIDSETHEGTPMFLFQLTEAGLEMDWQLEGLNNQYLYDTILSSLGFLQLSVADMPETVKQIPLFTPEQVEPVEISALAELPESETPEIVVELPFATELWQNIFTEMNPPKTLVLEVRAEPKGNWVRMEPSPSPSEFHADVQTSQQVGKPTEGGETVFEKISIPFGASVSLEKIVWKGDEYAGRLQSERENIKSKKADLEKKVEQIKAKIFDNRATEADKTEREGYEAELKKYDIRLKEIEGILEKLPAAYTELGQNESARFYYSVSLESADGKRKLLILTTDDK